MLLSFAGAVDQQNIEIVVVEKDKLINICRKYLELPGKWSEIAKINRLSNPNLILPGQRLIIPVALLKGVPLGAKVSFIKGDVQTRSKYSELWRPLYVNDVVAQGDSIKTGDASTAEIMFEDSTSLLMRGNTAIEIRTSATKGFVFAMRDFFLSAGRTVSRLKAATGMEQRFKIYTPSAVAAARGTEFRVSVDTKDAARAEVLQGTIGVDAMEEKVAVSEGEGTLVRKNEPPLKPRKLLLPPSPLRVEPLYRVMPLVFNFEQVPGAFSYRVMLAKDRDLRDLIADGIVSPDQTVKVAGVEDGSYFMQSRSIDSDGLEGVPSELIGIRVRTNPLPPAIESPAVGDVFKGRTLKVKWQKVSDAVQYHLQIAEDKDFQSVVEEKKGLSETEYSAGSLSFKTYYFRVSSIAEDGYEGAWSKPLGITLAQLLSAPLLENPQINEKEINIRWSAPGEGATFHFQMARDREFQYILVDRSVDKTELALQKPDEAGTYYVRVSSIDATGYEGKFSPAKSFEIKRKKP
jgi:hypothetical protein